MTARAVGTVVGLIENRQASWKIESIVEGVTGGETVEQSFAILGAMIQRIVGLGAVEPIMFDTSNGNTVTAFECYSRAEGLAAIKAAWDLCIDRREARFSSRALAEHSQDLSKAMAARQGNMPIASAERLGIPWAVAAKSRYPVVALGHGKYRRLFWRHMTGDTPEIGVVVSTEKHLASQALTQVGLPIPQSRVARDLNEALEAARTIGWPVITKPNSTDFGTAVTTNIVDEKMLASAFAEARKHGAVLIEKHVEGDNHRLLVFQNECISVVRQTPAHVIGDGEHAIRELVELTNRSRSEKLAENWKKIKIDDGAQRVLFRQGFGLSDVPQKDEKVYLRGHTNLSVGGTMENVTDEVHPDNVCLAVKAAATLGIDLAGIDFVTTDITRSHFEVGGGIVEINVNPGFVMGEEEHSIEDFIIESFYPAPSRGRIPIVTVLESPVSTKLSPMLTLLIERGGASAATFDKNGVWLRGAQIGSKGKSLPQSAMTALSDHAAEAAVLAFTPEDFLKGGLGVDQISIAVATEIDDPMVQDAILGLAMCASAVVLPSLWVEDFMSKCRANPKIWCVGHVVPDLIARGSLNSVFLRGRDKIVIKPFGEAERELQFRPSNLVREDFILEIIATVGAALGLDDRELVNTLEHIV